MYALVEILGKQYKALEGAELKVDKINSEAKDKLEFASVLALSDGDKTKFGTPYVKGAKVVCSLKEEVKGNKVKVYKFHRRKGYRRTQGHRQQYSVITVDKIIS